MKSVWFVISLFLQLLHHHRYSVHAIEFPRQAPFCVTDQNEPDLGNFKEIFKYYNENPTIFVPVSPDTYQSPTGFISNISLTRIFINSEAFPGMKKDHPYRDFHNYFHIKVVGAALGEGLEGLYMQAISAPLGVPFGEFVADFDCGDCGKHATSSLEDEIAIVPCEFQPAASYLAPVILSIGGKSRTPKKFYEAHFHFRYVDYPCFDVTFAQFLVIAVRKFKDPLQYEVYYSSMYKVGIEGVGAPFPMYYGLTPSEINCHHFLYSYMNNWIPQRNQKAKIKYSVEFDQCTFEKNSRALLGEGNICPPGPVTCGTLDKKEVINSGREWSVFRSKYSSANNPETGTSITCLDCGQWEDHIGPGKWPRPPLITDLENVSQNEIIITQKPLLIITKVVDENCDNTTTEQRRGKYARPASGTRNRKRTTCPPSFALEVEAKGYNWGLTYIIQLHSALMIFTWTVGSNCLIYCARFLKEASFAEKGSGCFSIGRWLWEHLFFTYLCFFTMISAVFVVLFTDLEALCQIYDSEKDFILCVANSGLHKLLGSIACILFFMSFLTGWVRPQTRLLRNFVIYYHIICGYIAKYLGFYCLVNTQIEIDSDNKVFLILLEVSFICFFIIGTLVQWRMDSQMKFRVRERRAFPVPEGIDTFSDPPGKNFRALLFPILVVVQVACYVFAAFDIWDVQKIGAF